MHNDGRRRALGRHNVGVDGALMCALRFELNHFDQVQEAGGRRRNAVVGKRREEKVEQHARLAARLVVQHVGALDKLVVVRALAHRLACGVR